MNVYYTYESGVRFHEQLETLSDSAFLSFTLIGGTRLELWSTWRGFCDLAASEWPVTIKWRTVGYSLEEQKIQEIRLQRQITKSLSPNGFLKKNQKTKIHSYLDFTNTKNIAFDLNELTQHRNTLLILERTQRDPYSIWSQLSENDKTISQVNISRFLKSNRDTFIARFLESDTHSTAQVIILLEHSTKIRSILTTLKTKETNAAKMHDIINNF